MSKLKTALAFSKNVLTTGALFQTSTKVEQAITSEVPTQENQVVVEYGMGHGNITAEILKKLHPTSKLYSFEINEEFCAQVKEEIKDDRLIIINAGAEDIVEQVAEEVDAIVSSIPFTLFSKEKVSQILSQSYDKMKEGSFLSQVQYSKVMRKNFESHFDELTINQVSKIPPEIIYHCLKK